MEEIIGVFKRLCSKLSIKQIEPRPVEEMDLSTSVKWVLWLFQEEYARVEFPSSMRRVKNSQLTPPCIRLSVAWIMYV